MKDAAQSKGTWGQRFAIRFFTLVLGVLIYWALGFLVDDIQTIPGPDYRAVEERRVDKSLVARQAALERQIAEATRRIDNQTERQRVVGDSSRSLQQTINQLLELQRLGMSKNVAFSGEEQANFSGSLNLFLDNQRKYQELSRTVSDMLERKQGLVQEKEQLEQELERQRQPARAEFEKLSAAHRLKLAFMQLAILLPLLVAAATLAVKRRASVYFPLFLAFGAAALLKAALVVHECFPSKHFKYILVGALLLVVAKLLIHFIRTLAFPKPQWLLKRRREAYEHFLCPVCDYPIRVGPRRHLSWTRRTSAKLSIPAGADNQEEAYVCPACGNGLFAECPACHHIRHALLPYCSHCGAGEEAPDKQ